MRKSSANRETKGFIDEAEEGTLFLDEVGDMPSDIQQKILRFIQEGEKTKVGSTKVEKVDVRIITATNRDLLQEIERGTFRKDLFYRLNVKAIHIPPLRERKEDISVILRYFILKYTDLYYHQRTPPSFSNQALIALQRYHWPGNIREFENLMQDLVTREKGIFEIDDLKGLEKPREIRKTDHTALASEATGMPFSILEIITKPDESLGLIEAGNRGRKLVEKEMILNALRATCWNRHEAAEMLGINYKTLLYKIEGLKIREHLKRGQ